MSSHREAPAISLDPAADSTDVYAFVDPNDPELVTIIANYVPFQAPDGGPNFYEFGGYNPSSPSGAPPVVYDININNDGTGAPNIVYRFTFDVTIPNGDTFLYADYPISATPTKTPPYNLSGTGNGGWNRPQTYAIQKIVGGVATNLTPTGSQSVLYCPPCNVGPRTTPDYSSLASAAYYTLTTGEKVFAGQRADAFWVDLGSIFDLGDLRPLSEAQLIKGAGTNGINSLADTNVHSIAIQVPITMLTAGTPASAEAPNATIGIWTTASRPPVKLQNDNGTFAFSGTPVQVSRLGNPLVNEVVVPMSLKDYFNSQPPAKDAQFAAAVEAPELQSRLVELYPGAFPNLEAFIKAKTPRADLVAIFATGIPSTVVPGFAGTYQGGKSVSEVLRLNTQIKPVAPGDKGYSPLGLVGGDIGGFPNGRRVGDDVVTIELTAVAGGTIPLVDPSYKVDAVVTNPGLNEEAPPSVAALATGSAYVFPYLTEPWAGFSNPTGTPAADDGSSGTNFKPTTTTT